MPKVGDRVVAIKSASGSKIQSYGCGVYVGDEVPPKEVCELFHKMAVKNPKIELDNGGVVWGFQVWWGDEDRMLKRYESLETEIVPAPTYGAVET